LPNPESNPATAANSQEEPLLPGVARGDRAALRACIQRYGALIWSIARRMSPSAAEAEDAVQEIFTQLWSNASQYDATRGPEGAFVALLARRRVIDRLRRHQNWSRMEIPTDDEVLAQLATVDSAAEQQSDAARAARVLATLPAEQRNAIVLSLLHGLSHGEIAARTALPLGTVKTLVRRGLLRIREALGVSVAGDEPREAPG
jgi:RNA polymerase sigma-70 factor (ECF subfamily)